MDAIRLKSMTGFALAEQVVVEGTAYSLQLRSVNSRTLEISVKLPQKFLRFEIEIKNQIKEKIKRGRVELAIVEEVSSQTQFDVHEAIDRYKELKAAAKSELSEDDLAIILPALVKKMFRGDTGSGAPESTSPSSNGFPLKAHLAQLIESFDNERKDEGARVSVDIAERLTAILTVLDLVEKRGGTLPERYQKKLLERITALSTQSEQDPQMLQRIAQEVALFADKIDITEELVRARSHLEKLTELLNVEESGKSIEFYIQELFREINTTGNKAQDAEISQHIVSIKANLEKIREQIQNIE